MYKMTLTFLFSHLLIHIFVYEAYISVLFCARAKLYWNKNFVKILFVTLLLVKKEIVYFYEKNA